MSLKYLLQVVKILGKSTFFRTFVCFLQKQNS